MARSHLSSPSLNPAAAMVGGGTPANIDMHAFAYTTFVSSAQPTALPAADVGSSSSQQPPPPWPKLLLDSGAGIHMVGYAKLLSNLHDAAARMSVRVGDGKMLPITKIGDIKLATPAGSGFTILGVHLAPGLKYDLISVRVLTRSRICTWFDGDRATLHAGPKLVGEAVIPLENQNGLYVLRFLSVPKIAAAAASSLND